MSEYVLSDRAKADLQDIWWYAFEFEPSEARADHWVDQVFAALSMLADRPGLGSERDWLQVGQVAFSTGRYLIVYEMTSDGIEIARVSGAHSVRGA